MARTAFVKTRVRQKLAAEIESLGAKSPVNQIRKAIFGPIEVRVKSHIRKKPLITVYLEMTSDDAARGSVDAMRQVSWLTLRLAEKSILHVPEAEDPAISASRKHLDRNKTFSDQFHDHTARICRAMIPDFQRAYRKGKPEMNFVPEIVPYEWEPAVGALDPRIKRDAARRVTAARHREAGASEVGYCKPPVQTRWKPGQSGNPSGRRHEGDDPWEAHRRAVMKIIRISSDGRSCKSTSIAVAVRQLFTEAMKGTLGAHQQVKKLLIMLDELNLLSPPPKLRRRSRRLTPAETADLAAKRKRAWTILLPSVKARMLEEYECAYGKIPPFETMLERHLAGLAPTPAPPTRVRTRSRPPAAFETAPTSHQPTPIPRPRVRTRSRIGGSGDV